MWFIHAMKYYPAIKRTEVLIYANTWINLKSIMLSERNEAQKAMWFLLYEMPRIDETIETKSRLVVARG